VRRILLLMISIVLSLILPATRHASAAELRDLQDLNELRAMVDHDKSITRVVLLLSPT
jgi:hypothetical protein